MKNEIMLYEFDIDAMCVDIENHVWITADKRRIPVRQMSTKHIKNCLSAIYSGEIPFEYNGINIRGWIRIFNQELINRN